ncbi:MAG: Amuc_1100 family pilus-like protein, partial [bacterium]
MQSHRKMIVIAVAVVISLLFLGAVALLIRGFIQFHEVETALQASKANLEMLYTQNPFPSSANRKQELENIKDIQQELLDLQSAMGAEQVEPVGQSPAKFITQFFDTKDRRLLVRAIDQNIKLPKGFDFGFGRHMKGDLPAPQDVPRLTQQLKIVEVLCQALYAGNITSLDALSRQEFEVDAVTGAGGKVAPAARAGEIDLKNSVDAGAGLVPEGQFYGRWRFSVQFKARESGLMKILNG